MSLAPGFVLLDKYRIEAAIGEGAFSQVYRATHVALNAPRALKVLRRDAPGVGSTEFSDFRQRFQLEAQLGAHLDHPHVVRVYDFEAAGDLLVLAMEYAAGGSLADLLRQAQQEGQPLPIAEVVRIAREVAEGLATVHALNAVHRDLKPSNILFDAQGSAKVADLGLAQVPGGPSQRSLGSVAPPHPGTPAYTSPEQMETKGYLTPASDVYALGVIIFEMTTGRAYKSVRPGTRLATLRTDVPVWLDELFARMVAPTVEARPWDGAEVARLLAQGGSARRTLGRRAKWWAAGVGLLLVIALSAGMWLGRKNQPADRSSQPTSAATIVAAMTFKPDATGAAVATADIASTATDQARQIAEGVAATLAAQPTATPLPPAATADAAATAQAEADLIQKAVAATMTALPTAPRTQPATILIVTASPPAPTWTPSWSPTPRPTAMPAQTPDATATAVAATVAAFQSRTPRPTPPPTGTPNPTATAMAALAQVLAANQAAGIETTDIRINERDGAIYILIPASEFTMGSAEIDAPAEEKPQHAVWVDAFWMMRTEVTNAQYARCVAAGACTAPNNGKWQDPLLADHPVTDVDWKQAGAYAQWAGGRLPTEAEWEKACRGEDGRRYPWGNAEPTDQLLNFNNRVGGTTSVGSYPAGTSPFGLLDMAGNVWEWTGSLYKPYPYRADDGREDAQSQETRVLRGGAFNYDALVVRCAFRYWLSPVSRVVNLGFRVVSPGL